MSELPFDKLLVALRHKRMKPRKQLAADTGRVMNEQQNINEPLNGSDLFKQLRPF